jgi:cysteinyl-tRNA synthetase
MSAEKEVFRPIEEGKVGMYACGPTVYDVCHIGHARATTVFDVIARYLIFKGYEVTYVRNITDIDDKIIKRANEEGVSWDQVAERYTKEFWEDMKALGNLPPSMEPKATEYIPHMHKLIQTLIDKGFAYVVDGDVYFSVRKFPSYGRLSKRNMDELMAGARVDVDERKADPLDFALWKSSKPGEPWWDSPWGKGRPGWHIECSAMTMNNLGATFDIHGGGKDLIFPHHENEMAQSEAASGKTFARYWLHNGFVTINQEKMSKSLGNFFTIKEVLRLYHPEVLRFFLLTAHYRNPIDYSDAALNDAKTGLSKFYSTFKRVDKVLAGLPEGAGTIGAFKNDFEKEAFESIKGLSSRIEEAMDDDFNTALAIGYMFEALKLINRLCDEGRYATMSYGRNVIAGLGNRLFGLFSVTPEGFFRADEEAKKAGLTVSEEEIEMLIVERNEARKSKDFKRADEIRNLLLEKGVALEDTPKGTVWKVR